MNFWQIEHLFGCLPSLGDCMFINLRMSSIRPLHVSPFLTIVSWIASYPFTTANLLFAILKQQTGEFRAFASSINTWWGRRPYIFQNIPMVPMYGMVNRLGGRFFGLVRNMYEPSNITINTRINIVSIAAELEMIPNCRYCGYIYMCVLSSASMRLHRIVPSYNFGMIVTKSVTYWDNVIYTYSYTDQCKCYTIYEILKYT